MFVEDPNLFRDAFGKFDYVGISTTIFLTLVKYMMAQPENVGLTAKEVRSRAAELIRAQHLLYQKESTECL